MTYWALLLIISSPSYAVVACPPATNPIDADRLVNAEVLKTEQVDSADRRLAAKYAAEHGTTEEVIKQRYAATGDLVCNGEPRGQANVTLVGDVITTAAHSAFDKCGTPKSKLDGCQIRLEVGGDKLEYDVGEVINTGWVCGTSDVDKGATDWAVLRLKKKVDARIKPYGIAPEKTKNLVVGSEVMAVAKSQDWPKDKIRDILKKPRHYGDCEARGNMSYDSARAVTHNCDVSGGSSGGALLTRGSDPTLLGIISGVSNPEFCKIPKGKKSGPSGDCWYTQSAAIAGDFKETLEEIQRKEAPFQKYNGSGSTL